MGVRYWKRFVPLDGGTFGGLTAGSQIFSTGGVTHTDRLRRTVGSVYFEAHNPDPDFVNDFGGWGVNYAIWALTSSTAPPPPESMFSIEDVDVNSIVHMEWLPGEQFRTTESGVPIFRFPSGGGASKFDTPAQRVPDIASGQVSLWITFAYSISNEAFDAGVLHTHLRYSANTLWETL